MIAFITSLSLLGDGSFQGYTRGPPSSRMDSVRVILRASIALVALSVGAVVNVAAAQKAGDDAGSVRITVRTTAGAPIAGAQVRAVATGTVLESDERGVLTVPRVAAGGTWLTVRRIGYRPDSVMVNASSARTTDASIALTQVAVELGAVRVFGRQNLSGPMAGFYHRQSTGSGRFFTYADIAKRAPNRMTDLLRGIPGIRIESRYQQSSVRIRGSRCAPLIWLDGQPLFAGEIDLDALDPLSFDGIEVYTTASVPVEFQGNQRVSSSCGTLLLWSRRGEARSRGESKKKNGLSPAAQIAQMLEELKVYTAQDVDVVARLDSTNIVRPLYPDSLFEAQTGGRLVAEFVVGTNGTANIETYSAVTTTHVSLIDAVRHALREQRFFPAVRQGKPVQQVVQLPFDFVPDSTARRRR